MPPKKDEPAHHDEAEVQAEAAPVNEAPEAADAASEPVAEPAPDPQAPDVPFDVAVMWHPDDPSAGASHGGQAYEADADGFLIVPLGAVEALKCHGFVMLKGG